MSVSDDNVSILEYDPATEGSGSTGTNRITKRKRKPKNNVDVVSVPPGEDAVALHIKLLKERENTMEGILGLLELGERVETLLKRTLWAAEADISILEMFSKMHDIHAVRQLYSEKHAAATREAVEEYGIQITPQIRDDLTKQVKASLPKSLDYGVLRTTDEVKTMLQSILNVGAISAQCCINGAGPIIFPAGVAVPNLKQLKVEYLSGAMSGRLPEHLRVVWLCGTMPLGKNIFNLAGLSELTVLVVTGCGMMANATETLTESSNLKCIITLCKAPDCKCDQLVKKKFGLAFGGQVIIVPDNRYDGKALTHTESFRKAMFQKRRGMVFHKGPATFKKFAVCRLPTQVRGEHAERKKLRMAVADHLDF
uniref:Nop domain-containing protein n=1 Tax=Strongyloides papillosus TaxID=174720 RepID=A0A0N5CG83_STREA